MAGQPKIFIVNACRGEKIDVGFLDSAAELQDFSDILIACSSHENHKSIRVPWEGTFFIQSLCETLQKANLEEIDFLEILRRTKAEVAKKEILGMKQIPGSYNLLKKKFYLK